VASEGQGVGRQNVLASLPGQRLCMRGGELVDVVDTSAFIRPDAQETWPSRAFEGEIAWVEHYERVPMGGSSPTTTRGCPRPAVLGPMADSQEWPCRRKAT
jgi:hypothetical protein